MVSPNISKRFSWMYEDTAGTTLFNIADDISYYFGIYNDDVNKWNYPTIENKIINYYAYNGRNPYLVDDGTKISPFTRTYVPTSAQHLVWQMGKCTDGNPDTFSSMGYDKEQYAISIRGEQHDGTHENFMQLNGCFSTKLYGVIQAGSPYTTEQTWNYMNYEDHGGGKPLLTRTPIVPDTSDKPYVGLPKVDYDYLGTSYVIPNIVKFDYTNEAMFSQAYTNESETAQVI